MRNTLTSLVGLALALTAGVAQAQVNTGGKATTANHNKQVIGYITQWDAWKTTTAGLPGPGALTHLNIDYSKYTMLNFSFFGIAVDGSLHSGDHRNKNIYQSGVNQEPKDLFYTDPYSSWDLHILFGELELANYLSADVVKRAKAQGFDVVEGGSSWSHPTWGLKGSLPLPLHKDGGAPGLLELAHSKNVKVMASIGGWSMCKHFPEMAADPVKRKRFIDDCKKLMAIGFDGIDLDWEYPGPFSGMNFTGTAADYGNFQTLVKEIRAAIGPNKLITAAMSADPKKLQGFDWNALNSVMDYFNFMTYDYNGGWSDVAGHNSPLADYPESEAKNFNHASLLNALKGLGVNTAKVSFGMPFYGRGVIVEPPSKVGAKTVKRSETVQPDGPITTCADYTNWAKDVYDGTPNYEFIRQKGLGSGSGWVRGWDSNAQVPFLTKDKFFLSYDDAESITKKAEFIKANNLAGTIIWTVYGDLQFGGSATSFGTKLKRWSDVKSPLVNAVNEAFATTGGNQYPTVRITTPVDGLIVKPGTTVSLLAEANDTDGRVVKVEYFDGGIRLGEAAAPSYEWVVTNIAAGSHSYTAKATDDKGASTVSTVVRVSALSDEAKPPVVSLVAPTDGSTYTAPAAFDVNANASDPDGSVVSVEFFQGTKSLGVDTTTPYSVKVQDLGEGSYSYTAVATDNQGLKTTSNAVAVKVEKSGNTATPWAPNVSYKVGQEVSYGGKVWVCKYAHTSNSAWYPGAAGLWFWVEKK